MTFSATLFPSWRWVCGLALAVLVSFPATGAAQVVDLDRRVSWRPPSLVWPAFLGGAGSGPDIRVRLGLKPIRSVPGFVFPGRTNAGPRTLGDWATRPGETRLRRRLVADPAPLRPAIQPPDSARLARIARLARDPDGLDAELPLAADLSGLDIEILGRPEIRGDWTRFRPCDANVQATCRSSIVPQLDPAMEFGVRLQGAVTDRIQLDVDFDQAREFSAANNINVFYQGKPDEVLQRLELGDVTFQLPSSRFLTEGIPAGNFGFRAQGQVGPMDLDAVWAQQSGDRSSREFRLSGAQGQEAFVQADTLVLDDADYARGQFFFLVDPAQIRDYPHIDALDLDPSAVAASVAPGAEPIQLYRFETDATQRQQVQGLIQADAFAERDGDVVEESGWFRYLIPGEDYTIHSSGLWVVLRRPLRDDEMLAVTYVTGRGDQVGDYNPEAVYNAGSRPRLQLLKASYANHQPGRPTWDYEMHQVYRVSSAPDVDPASVELTISLGELSAGRTFGRTLEGTDVTWLRLFGLDEESPIDALDPAAVFRPERAIFQDQRAAPGVFIVFPTLEPFRAPPPLRSLDLTAEETAQILGGDANERIYASPDPFARENGGLFRLTIPYEVRSQGVISSFSLGAFAIRDGSERIFLGDRMLQKDVDYTINYDVGQVSLIRPELLFASALDPVIRASWEQKALFQVAPTTVLGLNGYLGAGAVGGFNFLALHQDQQTIVRRPQLGTEPAAITLGGLSMDLEFPATGLDRLVESVPGLRLGGPSRLGIEGELALSLPNPNTRTDVFVDDFDSAAERSVSLLGRDWQLGSAPDFRDGAEDVLPLGVDAQDAGFVVWQHTWIQEGVQGDSLGVFDGFLPQADIDRQINVAGSQARENGLRISFEADRLIGEPSWRSITSGLSQTGLDLTQSDFLEFYAAGGDDLTLIIDLGSVAEDALFIDNRGATRGTKSTGVPWGEGILDHEADPGRGEIWSDVLDQVGVWDEGCQAERGAVYRVGDPRANCTRGNGRRDSEDLDGDGNLDGLERHLRFVVRLDGRSPFLARTSVETGTPFQLYRIPLRGPDALQLPRALTEADFRAIKHMRLTFVGEEDDEVVLARMRIVGSRWVRRGTDGVLEGIAGDFEAVGGRAAVGPVSRVTDGQAYSPPPGVLEELDDPTVAAGGQGVEFNEKGLKLVYEAVDPGTRAEVYNRFPQRPRDFLTYREMRLWAVAREGDWSPHEPLYLFVKVGEDAENFYLYRTPLLPAGSPSGVLPTDWLPEVRIDFEEWIQLRTRAESALAFDPPDPFGDPLVLWSADSTYAIAVKDRARAPNLAAVREVSIGIQNELGFPTSGEVWINEMRLSDALRDAGLAGHFAMNLDASDVWSNRFTVSSRSAFFRQLEEAPTFQNDQDINLNSRLRADRFTPAHWGVEIPVTVTHSRTSRDPSFLSRSDVQANRLTGLREPSASRTRVDVQFRKSTPTSNPVVGLILDGLEARAGYFTSNNTTITSVSDASGFDARVGFGRSPGRRDIALFPEFLRDFARWVLPGGLGDRVANARLRWTPERIRLGTDYARVDRAAFRFDQIVSVPEDSLAVATLSPRESLENVFELALRPLENLRASTNFVNHRDLLPPGEAVADPRLQELLREERTRVASMDVGWETGRILRSNIDFTPRLSPWLGGRLRYDAFYSSDRNANLVRREVTASDTLLVLERDVSGQRTLDAQATMTPARFLGAPAPDESGLRRLARVVSTRIEPINVTWQGRLTSRFDREPVSPGLDYQLGWIGRDDFLIVDGDSATTLTDRETWTARSGVRLPGGVRLQGNYYRSESNTLDTRSDRRRVERRWPDVGATVTALRMPDMLPLLRQLSLTAGFRRSTNETTFGVERSQRRFTRATTVPTSLQMTWNGGIRTTYRGSTTEGLDEDPAGRTERDEQLHELSVAASFLPPAPIAEWVDRPITSTVFFTYRSQRNCRITPGQAACVAFLDEIIRTLNLRFESAVDRMDLSVQLSYSDQQSFVGIGAGNTQFLFGVFGSFRIVGQPRR